METKSINRRLFATTFLGAAGAAALVAMMPPSSEAIAKVLMEDPNSSLLPNLDDLKADSIDDTLDTEPDTEEGEQLAWHNGYPHRRRRRRRVRRWRRVCRREYWNGIYRRRCRRRPFWIWLSIG
jgi:hypothetical protein